MSAFVPTPSDAEFWGKHYAHPSAHDDRLWVLVAAYDGDPGGYAVEVYEARAPARFYRIVALPTGRSETPGFVLEAGAGVGIELLAKQLAEAVVGGMLKAVPNVST